jgi:hypothetical protein
VARPSLTSENDGIVPFVTAKCQLLLKNRHCHSTPQKRSFQGVTVKVAELAVVPPVVETAIFPVTAPVGTVTVT